MARLGEWSCKSGKIPHLDRAGATDQLVSMRRAGHGDGMRVYRCDDCDCWHIGHPIGSRRRRKRDLR